MSIQAMSWALKQQVVTDPSARHILLCLANYADAAGGSAFPSVQTLCRDTGLSERTARYKLDELEKAKVIKKDNQSVVKAYIDRADHRPISYKILMTGNGVQPLHPEGSRGANGAGHGVQPTTPRGAAVAPDPSVNRHKENRTASKSSAEAWLELRACIRDNRRPTDENLLRVVNDLGGLRTLGDMSSRDLSFLRKDFEVAYGRAVVS